MRLSLRISLIVFGFVVVIIAGLLVTGQVREELLLEEQERSAAEQSQGLWRVVVENALQKIQRHAAVSNRDTELYAAFVEMDRDRIAATANTMLQQLKVSGEVDRLDLVDPEGGVVFSSVAAFEPSVPVRPTMVRQLLAERRFGIGVGNDASRNVTLSMLLPLFAEDTIPIGGVILSKSIKSALNDLKETGGVEALLVNRRGRLLAGTAPELWTMLRDFVRLSGDITQSLEIGNSTFNTALLPLHADLGNLVATLVVVRDISASSIQRRQLLWFSLILVGGFLCLAMLVLLFYVHRALKPLTVGVSVLNTLSRGDTSSTTEVQAGSGDDELARIGRAVNAFRFQTISLRKQRLLRERWRQRQEGFIRSEMIRLADILAGNARDEILSELSEIEKEMQKLQDEQKKLQEEQEEEQKKLQQGQEEGQREKKSEDDFETSALGLQMTVLAFEKMTDRVAAQQNQLTSVINDLQQALKARRALVALQRDLEIAARVQSSFLPGERYSTEGVEIRATMAPARDVGGDFYDFFELDEDHIGIVVADVAGKGVPAALFMAVARNLIRAVAIRFEREPGPCLEAVNGMLVDSTREDIFVTVFYGVYNHRDGMFVYANGGHNAPMLITGQEIKPLPLTNGVLLAMFDGLKYEQASVQLPSGSKLFLYTDGVPESINAQQEEFGEERMVESLNKSIDSGPADTIELMRQAVDMHSEEAEQFDDITMLVLAREPVEDQIAVARWVFRNDLAELPRLADETEAFGKKIDMKPADILRLQLALDEVITNIVNYAFPEGGRHEIHIRIVREDDVVGVHIEDQGMAFDPLSNLSAPSIKMSIEERRIGGLGIHLVRELMDDVKYERVGSIRNRLILKKRIVST